MKALLLSGVIAATLLLSGCDKKDSDQARPSTAAADLTGRWTMIDEHVHRVNAGGTVTYDRTNVRPTTVIITSTEYTEISAGDTLTLPYTRSGNTLTLDAITQNVVMTVENLTANALTLRQVEHDIEDAGDTQTTDARFSR